MNVARILGRLERVRQTGPGRWIVRCPTHVDRSPSLSIRELDDGRVLMHCFAGCGTDAVLAAIGLTLADLFERPLGEFRPSHSRASARDLLEIIDLEALVVADIALRLHETGVLSAEERARLLKAVGRIGAARDHSHGR